MKKMLTKCIFIPLILGGCISENQNSEQIGGFVFKPSYGINAPQIISIA